MNLPAHEQPVVDLREHESRKLSYGEIRRLGSEAKSITDQDKRFYDELKKKLDITKLNDGLHIVAKQYVGVARFDGFTVNVHPKITFKNAVTLPRMIEFAHGGVDDSGVETEFVGGGDALREMLIRSIDAIQTICEASSCSILSICTILQLVKQDCGVSLTIYRMTIQRTD